jgi:branched-chain amino acid transport system substrate-binding protein
LHADQCHHLHRNDSPAKHFIVQDKAQFLFGPYSSGLVATAAVISEQYGKLMLITGGAEPKTYDLGNKNLFQALG